MAEKTVGELRAGANAVLADVELQEVFLARSNLASRPRQESDATLSVGFSAQTRFDLRSDGDLHVWLKYLVFALPPSEAEKVSSAESEIDEEQMLERSAWSIESEWVAKYSGDADTLSEHTHAELNAFAIVMGPPTVHPYARDLVQSLTGRSEHAAFTLGLLTPVSAMPDDAVIDIGDSDESLLEDPPQRNGSS